jgi:hypothetical protein
MKSPSDGTGCPAGYFIGALYWHYILEKALLLRVLPLHSFLAARLKQHPPTHLPTHSSNLVPWICGAASKQQQQNGFSSSIKLDPLC